MMRGWRALPGLLLVASTALPVHAQQERDPKADFVRAIGQFSLALDGAYGDEGPAILSHLESMRQALARWDALIGGYEARMRSEIGAAEPPLALRMHLALGGIYLDRGRVTDALRELVAARQIDDRRADVHLLLGYASRLSGDRPGSLQAFRRASALEPDAAARAYVLLRHLEEADVTERTEALQRVRTAAEAQLRNRAGPSSPFVRVGLLPEVTGIEPFLPPVRYAEGFALLVEGKYDEAIRRLRDAAAGDPLTAAASGGTEATARAAASFRDGEVADALRHLEAVIAAAPDRAEPHRVAGLVYAADEQYENAVRELSTAIRLDATDERARTALADAYFQRGDLTGAEQTLRATLEVFPASARTRYALARVYQRQGQYAAALQELRAVLPLHPLLAVNAIYETIGNLEAAQQNFDGAVAAYATRVDIHPNDADAHHDLGATYSKLGRHLEAEVELLLALMLDGRTVESHAALAQVYLAQAKYAEAVEASRGALALDPAHREARYVLATSLIRLGKTDEGTAEIQTYQRLLADDSADRTRRFNLEGFRREAAVRSEMGAYAEAVALLRQALTLAPESGAVHLDLGVALLAAGEPAEAIEHFSQTARLDGTPEAYRRLADAYSALGQADRSQQARAIYQRMKQDAIRARSTTR